MNISQVLDAALEKNHGTISFEKFMEIALYDSQWGYYSKGKKVIGRCGDFYTNASVGEVYGEILGLEFEKMWRKIGSPSPFTLIEQGANDAQLMIDVLNSYSREKKEIFKHLQIIFIEPRASLLSMQKEKIEQAGFSEICTWIAPHSSLSSAKVGIYFSNELLDSFPVRCISFKKGKWRERCVEKKESGYGFCLKEIPRDSLLGNEITSLPLPPIEGYETEVNLRVRDWVGDVDKLLEKGFVITVDYGFFEEEYYEPSRREGTLRGYYQHKIMTNPFLHLGEQDLTAHVNFSPLIEEGSKRGLKKNNFLDQHHFLIEAARPILENWEEQESWRGEKWLRGFKTLVHPEIMGRAFHVLIQSKNMKL